LGISYVNAPDIFTDEKKGILSLWESYLPTNGERGTTVIINPTDFKSFADSEKEKYMLLNASSGKSITYYIGYGWTKSGQFKSKDEWLKYVANLQAKLP
jgi:hypothetical protein